MLRQCDRRFGCIAARTRTRSDIEGVGSMSDTTTKHGRAAMLTTQLLNSIERDAESAPNALLRLHARAIRTGMDSAPEDLRDYAAALLLKLDHLEHQAVVARAQSLSNEYLAPALTWMEPMPVAA
jgi:hypothetical protein